MSKHTPAPWKIFLPKGGINCTIEAGPVIIATVWGSANNAALIAQAPNLLAVLKAIYSGVKTTKAENLILTRHELQAIEDAIAKVDGAS